MNYTNSWNRTIDYNQPFNMGIRWLQDIAEISFKITECRKENDMISWYYLLWDLVDRMSFEMTEEEKKEIQEDMEWLERKLNQPSHILTMIIKNETPLIRKKLSDAYKKFLKIVNEKERIFKKKKQGKSWEDDLLEDF
jgi:hypothetical protein